MYHVRFISILGTSTCNVLQSRAWPKLQRNWVLITLKPWYVRPQDAREICSSFHLVDRFRIQEKESIADN
jgi:hypothetical protein